MIFLARGGGPITYANHYTALLKKIEVINSKKKIEVIDP